MCFVRPGLLEALRAAGAAAAGAAEAAEAVVGAVDGADVGMLDGCVFMELWAFGCGVIAGP